MMPKTKHWYASKTLWFNAVMAALGALEASAGLIQGHINGNVYGYGLLLLTIGNAVLRVVSNQAISFKQDI